MKRIFVIFMAVSISLSTLFVFSGCGNNENGPTAEFSATQEEVLKENEELKKYLREKGSNIDANDYKTRLTAFDKVENKYKFNKDDIKNLEIIEAGFSNLVKINNDYYAWGCNNKDLLTTKEEETINKSVSHYIGPTFNELNRITLLDIVDYPMNITKGVVKYYVPDDVKTLREDSIDYPAGITKDGKVCIWKTQDYVLKTPIRYIEHKDKIVDVLRFRNTIYYITSKGEIYSNAKYFGKNNDEYFEVPPEACENIFKIYDGIEAESFCRGSMYQLVVKDKKGDYYFYEYNFDEAKTNFNKFEIPNEKIIKAESGYEQTYLLTEKGNVYSYGRNEEPYIDEHCGYKASMIKLNLDFKVKDLSVNFQNVFLKDDKGNLYGIGPVNSEAFIDEEIPTKEYLYRENKDASDMVMSPRKINIPDKVTDFRGDISGGICKTQSGDLYVFGSNMYGQHLDGTRWSTYKPTKITK